MKIPETVKIAGYQYDIERPAEAFVNDDSLCDGVHIFAQQKIKVATTGTEIYQKTVFLHELVHGIISSYCGDTSEELNEKFTEQFAKGLYQVIVDNPDIFKEG